MSATEVAGTQLSLILESIRAEYSSTPGMRLTGNQICRLWHLTSEERCSLVEQLVAEGFLVQDDDGRYCLPEVATWTR